MVGEIIRFCLGYKKLTIDSCNPQGLLNFMIKNMYVFDVECICKKALTFKIPLRHYSLLKKSLKDWNGVILCEKEFGIPKLVRLSLKRKGLILGSFLCVLLMYLSCGFIWEIRVVGNENLREEEVIDTLKYLGFDEGIKKRRLDLAELQNDYLLFEKRVSWIAINIKGNVAYAEISEREFPPERIDKNKFVNIVAKSDGIIERVDAWEGGKKVKIGDVVSKGQLLISAFFETKNQAIFFKNARGSVLAQTIKSFEVKVNKNQFKKEFTKNKFVNHSIKILGKNIPLHFDRKITYQIYEKELKSENIYIFGIRLPIEHISEKYSEYKVEKTLLNDEEARKQAFDAMFLKMCNELTVADIKSYEVNEESSDKFYTISCNVFCIEDIAKEKTVYIG